MNTHIEEKRTISAISLVTYFSELTDSRRCDQERPRGGAFKTDIVIDGEGRAWQ